MKEEIIALVPVMLLLARRLGYRPVVAVAMSLGAAAVGAAFSPINPLQVGIAQQLAQLPMLSGSLFRIAFLAAALGIWIWSTTRYAARTRTTPTTEPGPPRPPGLTAATLNGARGPRPPPGAVPSPTPPGGGTRPGLGVIVTAPPSFAMGAAAGALC